MRLLHGPTPSSRDADVASSRVAGPRLRPVAKGVLTATWLPPALVAAWAELPAAPAGWLTYVAVLVALLLLAGLIWFAWVRSEVRSLRGPAFLVLPRARSDRLAIAGADPQLPPARPGTGAAPYRTVPQDIMGAIPFAAAPGLSSSGGAEVVMFGAVASRPELPPDATLQFLPGRLECATGLPDIRFVRQAGPATIVTIGRAKEAPDRHIHVSGPTVSRLHARLRYAAGRWTVSNLSKTNPLRVNGRTLAFGVETAVLADGDRLELGEVAFIFRERLT